MQEFKINVVPEESIEQPKAWATMFHTTVEHIARFIALPAQSLKRADRLTQPRVQTRLKEVRALLRRVRPWFNSDASAWAWYIGEPLDAFGRLTPAEVVKRYGDNGIESINDWISEREMGGFQ